MARTRQTAHRIENQSYGILIDNPKNSYNCGAIIRSAGAFGCNFVGWSGTRFNDRGGALSLDTECAHLKMPVFKGVSNLLDLIPQKHECVAVELVDDAESLFTFEHPKNCVYLFGSEDNSLSKELLNHCTKKVVIPTRYCLNLAHCASMIIYDRMMKMSKLVEENIIRCPNCNANHYKENDLGYHCNACGSQF